MIDTTKIEPLEVESSRNKRNNKKGILSIISTRKNGHRIQISKRLAEELELKDKVQIAFYESKLLIGKRIPNVKESCSLKTLSNQRLAIYSAQLVRKVIEKLELDFNERVSCTFYELELTEVEDALVAMVWKGDDV